MSFEGRYQKVCEIGHYAEECVYMESDKCDQCGSKWIRKNLVDDTNEPGEGFDHSMEDEAKKIQKKSGIIASYKF